MTKKAAAAAVNPLDAILARAREFTKGKTPLVGLKVNFIGMYPNAAGDDLVEVDMGSLMANLGRSAKRTSSDGKQTGGNVNLHGFGKIVDPRAPDVQYQVGLNFTAIRSAQW